MRGRVKVTLISLVIALCAIFSCGIIFNSSEQVVNASGGIYVEGGANFEATGGVITGNTNVGITVVSGEYTIDGARFSGNTNGAIKVESGATLTLKNSIIENNTNTGNGGAIFVEENASLFIENCTFTNNIALSGNGGAIYVSRGAGVSISATTFERNLANVDEEDNFGFGGAIYASANAVVSMQAENGAGLFSLNQSINDGGAIYLEPEANCNISGYSFTDNASADGNGGAVYVSNKATLTAVGETNTMERNIADLGGAVYVAGTESVYTNDVSWQDNISTKDENVWQNIYFEYIKVSKWLDTGVEENLNEGNFIKSVAYLNDYSISTSDYWYTENICFKDWVSAGSTFDTLQSEHIEGKQSFSIYGLTKITRVDNGVKGRSVDIEGIVYIPTVIEGYDITSVIAEGFYEYQKITEIKMYEGLISIEDHAFFNCLNLAAELVFPNSLTTIKRYTFNNCSKVTSVSFGSSLQTIGEGAFNGCSSISSNLNFPETLSSIGKYAFRNCSKVTGDLNLQKVDRVYEYTFYGCSSLNGALIAYKLVSVGEYGFHSCKNMKTIELGSIFAGAYESAFYGCSSLEKINVVDVNETESALASQWAIHYFENEYSNPIYYAGNLYINGEPLTDVVFDFSNYTTTVSICKYTFYNCDTLTSITTNSTVDGINQRAFYDCNGLLTVTLNEGILEIGERAFLACTNMQTLTLPYSLTGIGEGAFSACSSLTKVNYIGTSASVNSWAVIEFASSSSNPIIYSGNLYINDSLLTSAYISFGKVNSYAFYNCDSLTTLSIYSNCKVLNNLCFYDCDGLTSISTGSGCTTIGEDVFYSCDALATVTIGSALSSMVDNPFRYCFSLSSITVSNSNSTYASIFNSVNCHCIVEKSSNKLVVASKNTVIPESVTIIGTYSYWSVNDMPQTITIPDHIQILEDYAYRSHMDLTFAYIGSGVVEIGRLALGANLSNVTIAEDNPKYYTVYYEGDLERGDCVIEKETNILVYGTTYTRNIPDGVVEIADYAFYGLQSAWNSWSIHIPDSVTRIGKHAFEECNFHGITIGDGCQTIDEYAFANMFNLSSLTIGSNVKRIEDYAFYKSNGSGNLYGPDTLIIPTSVEYIGYQAFGQNNYGENWTSIIQSGWKKITFEDPSNWYVVKNSTDSAISGTLLDLSDTAQNVTYLANKYDLYYWKKEA